MRSGGRTKRRNRPSPLARAGRARQRDHLEQRARATTENQIRTPKAQWQVQRPAVAPAARKAAPQVDGGSSKNCKPGSTVDEGTFGAAPLNGRCPGPQRPAAGAAGRGK